MKYLLTTTLLVFSFILCVNAQLRERTCHFGITFEISNNPNWGYGEPVILTVEPNSPADIAGVRPGDIIMEINGSATYLRNYQTITSWLFDDTSDMAVFTIRNLSNYFREYELPRRCRSVKSMDEADLASAFSFYSIEDTQERAFVLPLKVTTNKNVDFSDYHTFDFILDPNAPQVDSYINKLLEDALKIKGLTRNTEDPDFFIQTYYSYQPNPKFNAYEKNVDKRTWRFDSENKQMVSLPILSGDNPSAEYEGNFILELGLRFFEKKYIDPNNLTQIWEVSAKEYLTEQYLLEEYVKFHLPLILMQFPYSADKERCKYVVSFKKYNYTGICYNIDDFKTITDVAVNSPAYKAGIRGGMVVNKIDDKKFNSSKNEILNGYKRFITETMKYRNPGTRFTDANGFPDCMYWNTKDYKEVSKAFDNDIYVTVFDYLYNFEKYVSSKSNQTITVETKSNKYRVIPEIKEEVSIRAY